ncbi:MAG: NADPH-dependent F420 reductase [Anaerolineales bacterium]
MSNRLLITIAILGGTGKEGKGLAFRWARAGYKIIIGSRAPEKAVAAAEELKALLAADSAPETFFSIQGADNLSAAQQADIVALTVPYAAHRETLELIKEALKGKILVDVVVPLVPPQVHKAQMPPAGSAAQEAREILGKEAEIVDAFQNISFELLMSTDAVECDVLVTGTSKQARAEIIKLVEAAGLTGWDAGPLENASVVEGMTSLLIYMNKHYSSTHAGVKITGVKR